MKIAARISGPGALRSIARMESALAESALDAAADALGREAGRAREAAGIAAPLTRERAARRLLIGTRDTAAVAQELGTLDRPPASWLAPVLPAARAKVRAAAQAAVARALSSLSSRARRSA